MKSSFNNLNNLSQRILTALIGGVVVIASLYFSEWSYFGVFLLICVVAQLEFYKLAGLDGKFPLKFWGVLCGAAIFVLSFLIEKGLLHTKFYLLIFPLAAVIFLIELYRKSEEKPFSNLAFTFIGIIYIALPLSFLNLIVFIHGSYSWEIILGLLLILWANDSGAYFAGSKLGKRKLFARVSPHKTWEGSTGGAVVALILAYFVSQYFEDLTLFQWLTLSMIIIIGGTYGDLIESLFKRSIEIKDSGTKLPGHGGFLDRFDGLLLASPFIVVYLKIF